MRITVLTDLDKDDPASYDPVVGQVATALDEGGHETAILAIHADLRRLIEGLEANKPDLVFNLLENYGENVFGAVAVAGVLELMEVPYTGGGPGEYYLQQDKALTKKLLAFDEVRYPDFAVFSQDADLETGGNLRMPLLVKPLRMDSSIGIESDALVQSTRDMMRRVVRIHEKVRDCALVEEYIDGRELYVGILGNQSPQVFPPIEMDFTGFPEDLPKIASGKAKWKKRSAEYKGSNSVLAQLPDDVKARLQQVSLQAYRALRVRDYGRIDMRMTDSGEIYVLEVNASCYLDRAAEFAMAAEAAGLDYKRLINRIAEVAIDRRRLRLS